MSSNGDTSTVMKYITNGASDFLIKPLRIEELKNIWQHVFRKQIGAEHRKCNIAQHIDQLSYRTTTEATATLDSEIRENNGMVTDIQDLRKSRLIWTMQLHRQFIAAVNSLGPESECSISFPFKRCTFVLTSVFDLFVVTALVSLGLQRQFQRRYWK